MESITTKQSRNSSHTIPMDLFLDIACILLNNAIAWQLESINEKENSLLIQISIQPNLSHHRKALENIQGILSDYGYYLNSSPNDDSQIP